MSTHNNGKSKLSWFSFFSWFYRLGVRACVVMIPLLGITWLFGLLSPLHKAFVYIFTIFNSTQVKWIQLLGMKSVLIRYQRKSKFYSKLYYPFLTSLPGGKLSVIQRQSREPMINSSIGLDIFAAQQYLILRGLGLRELVWKHFESTKGVNVISEIAI